ncbi:MAG: NAD(P)-binding domain-containing protein [Pseudomonadota bacterium]|nr:NAD(P)-binding domain-containing protein [Pseudomonadota bacterium]
MNLGFIGLGAMGRPMALNLRKAGHALWVFARTPERAQALVEAGAMLAASPFAVAKMVDVLFLDVSDDVAAGDAAGRSRGAGSMKFLLTMLGLCALGLSAVAADMTDIRFQDQEPEQPAYGSRILILGERMRMDYGHDEEDFILFDRSTRMVWLVAHGERRLTGIPARPMKTVAKTVVWPQGWRLSQERQASDANALFQVRLNDQLCVEFKSAPILQTEARLLRDFRRALAGNQAEAWNGMPEALRQSCALVVDVRLAGLEYQQGLPLAIRYWDGRSRVYQSHEKRAAKAALFELPGGYQRLIVGGRP